MFESKWEADVVLPYIIPAQLHWNSEYSALKAQSKFMHNSWAAAKFSRSWKAELPFPEAAFRDCTDVPPADGLREEQLLHPPWMGSMKFPDWQLRQRDAPWNVCQCGLTPVGSSAPHNPLFCSPVKMQGSVGAPASMNSLFWPTKQYKLNIKCITTPTLLILGRLKK